MSFDPLDEPPSHRRRSDGTIFTHLPIGVVVAMIIQIGTFIWWGAGQAYQVREHERRLTQIENHNEGMDSKIASVDERLARIEEKTTMEMDALNRIESTVNKRR